jgi:hypothetical protein
LQTVDDNSGVSKTEYSLDGGSTWQFFSSPFVIAQNGTITIWYKSTDKAGNKEEATSTRLQIDTESPISSISLDLLDKTNAAPWFKSSVYVSLFASDTVAGVERIEYSLDSGNTWSTYSQPFIYTTEGVHAVLYRAIDVAGNVELIKEQQIEINTVPPMSSLVSVPVGGGSGGSLVPIRVFDAPAVHSNHGFGFNLPSTTVRVVINATTTSSLPKNARQKVIKGVKILRAKVNTKPGKKQIVKRSIYLKFINRGKK